MRINMEVKSTIPKEVYKMIKYLQIPQLFGENGSSKKYHRLVTTSNYCGVIPIDSLDIQNGKVLDRKAS